jgi:hypothetical protein
MLYHSGDRVSPLTSSVGVADTDQARIETHLYDNKFKMRVIPMHSIGQNFSQRYFIQPGLYRFNDAHQFCLASIHLAIFNGVVEVYWTMLIPAGLCPPSQSATHFYTCRVTFRQAGQNQLTTRFKAACSQISLCRPAMLRQNQRRFEPLAVPAHLRDRR